MTDKTKVEAEKVPKLSPERDEPIKIDLDPEVALRALLEVDPEDEPVVASALKRIRTAIPEELATPERHDALIQDALEAGATWEQIDEALNAPR
jgi:hypothetical protein